MKTPILKGERIYLKIPTMKDVDGIVRHANDKQVVKFLENLPHPYRRKDAVFFVKNIVNKGIQKKTDYPFAICLKENDEIIGCVGIHKIDRKHRNAELGYWLGRKFWRKGYGTEAAALALNFAFNRLRLNKVYSRAYHPNKGSIALLKKLGFKDEGLFRKHLYKHGRWYDEPRFGLLRSEYAKKD